MGDCTATPSATCVGFVTDDDDDHHHLYLWCGRHTEKQNTAFFLIL